MPLIGSSDKNSSTSVDLSRLPAPDVVEQLGFEEIVDAMLADLQARDPDFDATVESEPAVKVIQVFAWRELILRQAFNDRLRRYMLAFAGGSTLDHVAAPFGVTRLVLDPGNPASGIPPTLESDDELRRRVVLAPESYSVAGPELAYVFHARSASGDVLDASATTPAPGEVVISVLSRDGDGTAPPALLAEVQAAVGARDKRPVGDAVTVQSAQIVPFEIRATLYTFSGPDPDIVLAAARTQLDAYLEESRRLGRNIPLSLITARLAAAGVQRIVLTAPPGDVICSPLQAAHCTAITIVAGGVDE
jgi:phage-related baseplate assembly protein